MAGTRLLIVQSFAGPFLAWIAVCVIAGLRHDLLAVRFLPQAGRIALKQRTATASDGGGDSANSMNSLHNNISIPPVTIIAAESQVNFWESVVGKLARVNGDRVLVIASGNHEESYRSVCDDPKLAATAVASADLWICDNFSSEELPRLVLVDQAVVLYPISLTSHFDDLRRIYPVASAGESLKRRLQFTVLLDQSIENWKDYVRTVHDWVNQHDFGPCNSDIQLDVQRTDLLSSQSVPEVYHLSTQVIVESLFSSRYDVNALQVVLYVPFHPVQLVNDEGETSRQGAFGNNTFFAIANAMVNVQGAITSLRDRVIAKCFGLPVNSDAVFLQSVSDIASIPALYEKLYYGRALAVQYQVIDQKTIKVHDVLLALPASVAVSEAVAQQYWKAVDSLTKARLELERGHFREAVWQLEQTNELLQDLETDPALAQPVDFPLEQYVAIFAPLLFPLLMPVLASLIREYKRYRKLVQKRKEVVLKEKE